MPDYRVFKKSLLDTPQYGMLDIATQHLYMVLHLLADDQGRLQGHPAWVRSRAYPYQDISLETLTRQMESLEQAGLIITYTARGLPLIQITGWWDAQERMQWAMPSEYPPPDGWQDRERYRANNKILTQNWQTHQPSPSQTPKAPDESPAPDEPSSEVPVPNDPQAPSGKDLGKGLGKSSGKDLDKGSGKGLGKVLGKGLGKDLGKASGKALPEAMRREEKKRLSEKTRQESSPSPPSEEGGPGGETTSGGGEGGGRPKTPDRSGPKPGMRAPGNAAEPPDGRARSAPDDPRVRLLHAAGITNGKVPKILAQNLALDDILAELARCYDPRIGVRRPEIIAPRHILAGESPPATYRQPHTWQEHIPEAVLDAAGLGDWLETRLEQIEREARERMAEFSPRLDDGVQAAAPSPPRSFDGPDEVVRAWETVLNDLRMDMPKAAFDTWVRPATPLAYEPPNIVVVGTPDANVSAWLEDRLKTVLQRKLTGILDTDVQVRFHPSHE